MAKSRPIPTRPTYMHLNPALLQKIEVLKVIESEPTSAWWPNRFETAPPYMDYAEVEIIYAVIELLHVPVANATPSMYRAKARQRILQYLKDHQLR